MDLDFGSLIQSILILVHNPTEMDTMCVGRCELCRSPRTNGMQGGLDRV